MFRNKEFTKMVLGFCLIFVLCIALGTVRPAWGICIMAGGLILSFSLFYYYTWRRYRELRLLAGQIHQFQRSLKHLSLDCYNEGELSYLAGEIEKMELKLTEQAEMLAADKNYLADAISNISHQLKTPLTSMSMMADFLRSPDLPDRKREEFTANIRSQLARIEWLVQSLLKMACLDSGSVVLKRQPVNVALLIQKASAHLLIPIELKKQELCVCCDNTITIAGDMDWLREAIANILKNCMEHTDFGKTLRVDVSDNPLYVRIDITDEGCGIDKEDLPHIFERFYKGKNASYDSVGIGLAMAWQIIHQCDGDIQVESVVGKGTRFIIKLYK